MRTGEDRFWKGGRSLLALALAAGMGPAGAAAEASGRLEGFELGAGRSRFLLRPSQAPDQGLNGGYLGVRAGWGTPWSWECLAWRQTGTDARDTQLLQLGLQVGPRYTWTVAPRLDLFAHLLVGGHQLQAEQGLGRDTRASLGGGPGAGLDLRLGPAWLVRAQLDAVFTRYAGHGQRNLAGSLGLAYRWQGTRPLPPPAR